ncbi:MAG: class II aldolase/adducin family protein [Bacteroidia bacterium]|nr:class II aldolase/adducin family protein [Bacteroidia bacterium]
MEYLNNLLNLTSGFLNRPDLIQGPGGNTSVKDLSSKMYIKASGFRFEEISDSNGFSCVNYLNIRDYFNSVVPKDKVTEEQKMLSIVAENILLNENGLPFPKPSMETGFHAVLDRYVVHTHSVWTNLVNCASDRNEKLQTLRDLTGLSIADIPFVSPGFGLSYLVNMALLNTKSEGKDAPQVFMLANHGVIAHANSPEIVSELLSKVDTSIQSIFGINNAYPETGISGQNDSWVPDSNYVLNTILNYKVDKAFFEQVLFPDQTVFFKDNINFDIEKSGFKINIFPNQISYHCSFREALSIHETMTAYLFIYDTLLNKSLMPQLIGRNEIDYINNMDMEKHRKSLF